MRLQCDAIPVTVSLVVTANSKAYVAFAFNVAKVRVHAGASALGRVCACRQHNH